MIQNIPLWQKVVEEKSASCLFGAGILTQSYILPNNIQYIFRFKWFDDVARGAEGRGFARSFY